VDSHQSEIVSDAGQVRVIRAARPSGMRQCLLKGCACWFSPSCVQARYCSSECRQAACRWRRWRASRRYRASPEGRARRRAQSCRYREVQRESRRSEVIAGGSSASEAALPVATTEVPEVGCEGQRAAEIPQDSGNCACDRPGCYELFVLQARSPQQHFCSASCRQALRRVIERERRLRSRRRRGIAPRRRRSRGPPRATG
jgi:hypothetical protein